MKNYGHCCDLNLPDCDNLEMSNFQRCRGVTIHGCGNPLYNVYNWEHHAGPHCHADFCNRPEPSMVFIPFYEYLRRDEAEKTYATKDYVDNAVDAIPGTGSSDAICNVEYDSAAGDIVFKDKNNKVISVIHIGSQSSIDAYTKAEADAKFVTTADAGDTDSDVDHITPEVEEYINKILRDFGKVLSITGNSLQLKNGQTVLSTVTLPEQSSSVSSVFLTQDEYNNLAFTDNNTLYYITEN